MTDQDPTAPEAVEQSLDEAFDTQRDVEQNPCGAWQAIQALSAALEAERHNCVTILNDANYDYNRKTNSLIERHAQQITDLKARAEYAEAKLKGAVGVMRDLYQCDEWGVFSMDEVKDRARAFLATLDQPT